MARRVKVNLVKSSRTGTNGDARSDGSVANALGARVPTNAMRTAREHSSLPHATALCRRRLAAAVVVVAPLPAPALRRERALAAPHHAAVLLEDDNRHRLRKGARAAAVWLGRRARATRSIFAATLGREKARAGNDACGP